MWLLSRRECLWYACVFVSTNDYLVRGCDVYSYYVKEVCAVCKSQAIVQTNSGFLTVQYFLLLMNVFLASRVKKTKCMWYVFIHFSMLTQQIVIAICDFCSVMYLFSAPCVQNVATSNMISSINNKIHSLRSIGEITRKVFQDTEIKSWR